MTSPTTRSINGATYVPIDWDNSEDPGSENFTNVSLQNFQSPRLYDRAKVLTTLLGDPKAARIVADRYRQRLDSFEFDSLEKGESATHQKILDLIDDYQRAGTYQSLVSGLGDVELESLKSFAGNWLSVEKELLERSIDDVITSTREAIHSLPKKATAGGLPDSITALADKIADNIASEMVEGLSAIKDEIADVRGDYEAGTKVVPPNFDSPSTPTKTYARSIPKYSDSRKPAAARTAGKRSKLEMVSPDEIRRHLWDVSSGRESATFLSGYLAPNPNLSLLRVNPVESLLAIATKGVYREAANGLDEEVELNTARDAMLAEVYRDEMVRTRLIYAMLEAMELEPAGYLVLERLDFTPLNYVRGELVYSLPLTPGEEITVSHREWSKTTEEYTKVVEETIEEERMKAVSENTELAESMSSERQVTQRAEASADAAYSGTNWHVAVSGGWSGEWQNNRAIETSAKRSQETTSKASSRSKKEHKMTFRVARETHVEDEQVHVIQNATGNPVRWDFHRLMQKWQIDLYHLGERLTWDIVIPEPGLYLLKRYEELQALIEEIESGDPFDVAVGAINEDTWDELASAWGAALDPAPAEEAFAFQDSEEVSGQAKSGTKTILVEVPEGYVIKDVVVSYPPPPDEAHTETSGGGFLNIFPRFTFNLDQLREDSQKLFWIWEYQADAAYNGGPARIDMMAIAEPTDEKYRSWQVESLTRLQEAARARWIARLDGLQARRDRLLEELMGKDSLKLRQMEREEIMKAVLRWMLGPEFEFYKEGIGELASMLVSENEVGGGPSGGYGGGYSGGSTWGGYGGYGGYGGHWGYAGGSAVGGWGGWAAIGKEVYRQKGLELGPEVRFLHQAIEWENINWITYPYFWVDPGRWEFKQALEHVDFYHRNFLRAGWARIVLTIRPGFEWAWLARMAGLDAEELDISHPYLSLAREIEARASTTYAYTPAPDRVELVQSGGHVDRWFEYTPTGALDVEPGPTLLDH